MWYRNFWDPNVCVGHTHWKGDKSHSEASAHCAKNGGRLCSLEELEHREAGSGGKYHSSDRNYNKGGVWTDTPCDGGHYQIFYWELNSWKGMSRACFSDEKKGPNFRAAAMACCAEFKDVTKNTLRHCIAPGTSARPQIGPAKHDPAPQPGPF